MPQLMRRLRRSILEHRALVFDSVTGVISQADVVVLDIDTRKVYTVHIEDLDPTRHDFMGTVQVEIREGTNTEAEDERDIPAGITLAAIAHCIRIIAGAEDMYNT